MGYPKQRRRAPPAATSSAPSSDLRAQAPPERLAALRFAHARLLQAIAAKKKSLDKLDARIDDTARRMATLGPLRDQLVRLDGEVHRLFEELLARKRQPRDVRRALTMLHAFLIRAGVLAPAGWSDAESAEPPSARAKHGEDDRDAPASDTPPRDGGGFSARRPSDATDDQTLRTLFRRLAMAMHPDRVADDAEKARRTEAMKDLSRAYAERDLARLLALEHAWSAGPGDDAPPVDEAERQYARLEQMNRELRIQLQNLTAELKARKRSPTGRMSDQLRRPSRGTDPIASLAADLATGLAQLRLVHQRVSAFADGKLSLEILLATVAPHHPASPFDDDDDLADLFTNPEAWLRR